MSAGAVVGEVLPRPRGRVLRQAAMVLWLPTLLPLLSGLLNDCSHCVWIYLAMAPLVPGVIVPVLANLDDAWFFLAAVLPTLAQGVVLYLAGREAPRGVRFAVGLAIAIGVALQGVGLAMALRA